MSRTKELIEKEIIRLEKRRTELKEKINEDPTFEFMELRKEFAEKLNSGVDRLSSGFQDWVERAAKKEKQLKRKMKTQVRDNDRYWEQLSQVEIDITDLNNNLWRLNLRGEK